MSMGAITGNLQKKYPIWRYKNGRIMVQKMGTSSTRQMFAIENGPVEIVDLPIDSLVDLSIVM